MIDNKITFKEAETSYTNSYAGITTNNRFSLLNNISDYNTNFPSLPNKSNFLSQQPKNIVNRNTHLLSQPVPSTSRSDTSITKKRKHNISPSTNVMFPFVFGPSTALPPNTLQNNLDNKTMDNINNENVKLLDYFATYFIKLLGNYHSLDELKNLQVDTLKKGLLEIIKSSQQPQQ